MHDIEYYASGKGTDVDISGHDRGSVDRFDYSKYNPREAAIYKSLSKHLNFFFASPILEAKRNGVIESTRSPIQTVTGKDGQQIPVRKMYNGSPEDAKNNYFEFADSNGKGC